PDGHLVKTTLAAVGTENPEDEVSAMAVHKSIRWFVTPLNKTPRRRFDSWRLR
ncbi:unnamed protein product, partial [Ascophyllum nodosum]